MTQVTQGVVFQDIFKQRRTAVMTALENGLADPLFHGRMFIMGDAAHKVRPYRNPSFRGICF